MKLLKRLLICVGILVLTLSFTVPVCAEGGTESFPEVTASHSSGDAEEKGDEQEMPTGIFGLINGYISLCEGGGIVCRAFGTSIPAIIGGNKGSVIDIHPGIYAGTLLICAIFSYIVGSVNFGVIISKKMCHDDVRNYGSGNSGMTNMLRVYGKKAGVLTFLGDAGKAALCALVGLMLAGNGCGYVALAACMVGHAFPIFFGFKGGKAVACACGGMLVLEPAAALILFFFFAVIVGSTKYVSLGSIIGASLLPVIVNTLWNWELSLHSVRSYDYWIVCVCTVFYACFVIWLHRGNMKRLLAGEERKTDLFGKKKKNKENH